MNGGNSETITISTRNKFARKYCEVRGVSPPYLFFQLLLAEFLYKEKHAIIHSNHTLIQK